MKIEDASERLTQDWPTNGTAIAPAIEPGELSILQVEAEDSLEALLAVLAQHGRPVLIALPTQSKAFSQTEHFAQLKQASTPQIVGFVVPRERVTEITPYAHEYGFPFTSSFAKAETAFLQQRYRSGPLSPLPPELLWATNSFEQQWNGTPPYNQPQHSSSFQVSSFQSGQSGSYSTSSSPLHSLQPGQILGERAFLSGPHPVQSKQSPWERRRFLIFTAVVSLVLVVSATFLPSLFVQTGVLTIPRQNNGATLSNDRGLLSFSSSGQLDPTSSTGLNDIITLNLHGLTAPPPGMSYYAWLLSGKTQDTIPPILLGQLQVVNGKAQLTYQNQSHTDLLVSYSRLLVTAQGSNAHPDLPALDPMTWRYQGSIPDIPTPGDEQGYSLLSHLRHLLAQDPTLQQIGLDGGLGIWLYRNSGKLFEWANAARDDWAKNNPTSVRLMVDRVVEYLDGRNYAWKDLPANTPWIVDPKAGLPGLIDISTSPETPPAYIPHVRLHLAGVITAPGHTAAQQQLTGQIDAALSQIQTLLQQARRDAVQLAKMDDVQLQDQGALTLLNDLQVTISNAYIGTETASGPVSGVVWLHNIINELAQMSVTTATPDGP